MQYLNKVSHHLFFSLILICLVNLSCNKKDDAPVNNNEFKATVILSSGSIVNIDAKGTKAAMGCGLLGSGTFVSGSNESNAGVNMTVYGAGSSCVTIPGTYSFRCEYRVNTVSTSTPIYENHFAANNGSITFTAVNNSYMEGHFNAVCVLPPRADSVTVIGSFKGNY